MLKNTTRLDLYVRNECLMKYAERFSEHAGGAAAPLSEMDIIAASARGNKHAYKLLYDTHVKKVYALCYRLAGDKGMAEDATQEVFIQLWSKLDTFNGTSQFSTWLHSVAVNVTVSYLRKQRNWIKRVFHLETSTAMHMTAESDTSTVDLESLIQRLPERARMVFVLHAIEGYRHEDIAKILGMAVGSSKAQFHRAKHLLKEWMGCDDE